MALDQIRQAASDDGYRAGVGAFQRAMMEDPPAIFLAWPERARAVSRRFAVPSAGPAGDVLATLRLWRLSADKMASLRNLVPGLKYHLAARAVTWVGRPIKISGKGTVLVVCAGTSDIPVAEEAALTATMMANRVERLFDVGVAGIHRLLENRLRLDAASVLIVVAGMEGALPSVVAGLIDKPVIAVPTSVGYGASFNGLAALLGMLNSCAAGVTVVNIDNGFGAGFAASLINRV